MSRIRLAKQEKENTCEQQLKFVAFPVYSDSPLRNYCSAFSPPPFLSLHCLPLPLNASPSPPFLATSSPPSGCSNFPPSPPGFVYVRPLRGLSAIRLLYLLFRPRKQMGLHVWMLGVCVIVGNSRMVCSIFATVCATNESINLVTFFACVGCVIHSDDLSDWGARFYSPAPLLIYCSPPMPAMLLLHALLLRGRRRRRLRRHPCRAQSR